MSAWVFPKLDVTAFQKLSKANNFKKDHARVEDVVLALLAEHDTLSNDDIKSMAAKRGVVSTSVSSALSRIVRGGKAVRSKTGVYKYVPLAE